MKNNLRKLGSKVIGAVMAVGTALTLGAGRVLAFSAQEGAEAARADDMPRELLGADGVITRATNIVLYVVGAVSVIMLVWGGFRYIISGGDSKKVTDAKNTILYAIIGLIIAIMAYAIVNFVLNAIGVQTEPEQAAEGAGLLLNLFI